MLWFFALNISESQNQRRIKSLEKVYHSELLTCNVVFTEGKGRTKQNGLRLEKGRFGLDTKRQFFIQTVVRPLRC